MKAALEPRYVDGDAMLLAGLRRHHSFSAKPQDLVEQWRALSEIQVPGQVSRITYGVICGADPGSQRFEYMTAVQVSDFAGIGPELGRMRILPRRYAVFTHLSGFEKVRFTWDAIWHDWLPKSGYQQIQAPDFERYEEGYSHTEGTAPIEIWLPIS